MAIISTIRSFVYHFRARVRSLFLGPPPRIKLGTRYVGLQEPGFIIAEIGINHNGDSDLARKLIDAAKDAGADCVKFQMRDLESLYVSTNAKDSNQNLATQYSLDLLKKVQLPPEELFKLFDYAKECGLFPMCTPFDVTSANRLELYGMDVYKIGSPDLTNHDLIRTLIATKKPLIVSTGMADQKEILETNRLLRRLGAKYILLHCNSTYPAPFQDVQLQLMSHLGTALYGYSGHERGIHIAVAAVARGAKVIEKHITLDRDMEGTDHKASLLPEEFREMVEGIRQVEASIGSAHKRTMTQGERMNRATLAKSIVAARPIGKGETITADMVAVKSPGRGLQPNRKASLIGRIAGRNLEIGDAFFVTDLIDHVPAPRAYHFKRPWGVPVRFHDFASILERAKPDFLEFHMSYRDLEIDPDSIFDRTYDVGLVVHAVETFADDHILDLAAVDATYRAESIRNLQRCIDQTRALKKYFPSTKRPMIVVNAGGFAREGHIKAKERVQLYTRVGESLALLDADGVELIIQTMPPYPWLLGGQMFHNLFLDPAEIANFCKQFGYRVCFDTSHSYLAGNHLGKTLTEFINTIGESIAYLHIADGAGVGEEGLQISEGTLDFKQLAYDLNRVAPRAPFIPEIWQGHENEGQGFWLALERLEKWF